jgi:hypothetical protein
VDLEKLVSQVFPSNIDIVERSDFIELMSSAKEGSTNPAVKEVCALI